jgi:4-amino-4-deoxy-L-arabinose transferase-like glycosyltransferase
MLETGNWLVPYVGGEPYLRKPPAINWAIALAFLVTGRQDEFVARLPSVLGVLALACTTLWCGRRWLGDRYALVAAIAVLTTVALGDKGRLAEIEALYVAVFGIALLLWIWCLDRSDWERWILPAIPLGLGLLLKGPLHYLFFYGIVAPVLWRAKRLRELATLPHLLSLVLGAGIFGVWAVPHLMTPEAVRAADTWSSQFSDRLEVGGFRWTDWLVNFPRALSNFLPWVLFFPLGAAAAPQRSALVFGLTWGSIATFLVVMAIPESVPRYTMPLLVPIALLASYRIKELFTSPAHSGSPEAPARPVPRAAALTVWKALLLAASVSLALVAAVGFFWAGNRVFLVAAGLCGILLLWYFSVRRPVRAEQWMAATGFLAVGCVLAYCGLILPRLQEREILRPRAAQIAAVVPPPATLYAIDPGSQQVFYYLRKPWHLIPRWEQLPADARYLLVMDKDLDDLKARFDGRLKELLSYEDKSGKRSRVYEVE